MKYMDFPLKCVGQMGRTFSTRHKEHIHNIRSNNSNSGYSNHILHTGHAYGTITDTMDIITTGRKGKYLNTLERYHIYEISKENLHMNDTHIDTHKILYSKHCTRFTQNNSKPSPHLPHPHPKTV
jgi:hypothetical protein